MHNVHKQTIAPRVLGWIRKLTLKEPTLVPEGPRVTSVAVNGNSGTSSSDDSRNSRGAGVGGLVVTATFAGGTGPFYFAPTRNCSACCKGNISDFDVSADNGATWVDGNPATVVAAGGGMSITFSVKLPSSTSSLASLMASEEYVVRYTANQIFPQCALYNGEGLPALPFSFNAKALIGKGHE